MKNFEIQFKHPVKGVISIFKLNENRAAHHIKVNTNKNNLLIVSLAILAKGTWNMVLNWEYDDKHFIYNRSISIL